jgi:hypothetical protein
MMSRPRIAYTPLPDVTPEMELNALSACYSFILQKHQEKQKSGPATVPNDAKKEFERWRLCQRKV